MRNASEINYREATDEEDNRLLEMTDEEFENFLDEAEVVHEGTDLFAVVEGIAYHLEELARGRA